MKKQMSKKVPDGYDDGIFYVVTLKQKIPQSIFKKIQEAKQKAKGKIPILIIKSKDQKIELVIRSKTRLEERIRKLKNSEIIGFAIEHFLTCKGGKGR